MSQHEAQIGRAMDHVGPRLLSNEHDMAQNTVITKITRSSREWRGF